MSESSSSETASTAPITFPADAKRIVDEFVPKTPLHVSFGGHKVTEGSEITPTIASVLPDICFDGGSDKLYTIILSDPDAPSVADPKFAEWQHWIHVNATATDIQGTGESITAYFGSAPGKDSGKHHYCLVVYEQPDRIVCDEPKISATSGFPPRRSFNSRNFAKKYNLTPYTLLTYYAEWDERVPEFAAKLQGQ